MVLVTAPRPQGFQCEFFALQRGLDRVHFMAPDFPWVVSLMHRNTLAGLSRLRDLDIRKRTPHSGSRPSPPSRCQARCTFYFVTYSLVSVLDALSTLIFLGRMECCVRT
jgi:hypothetical protein